MQKLRLVVCASVLICSSASAQRGSGGEVLSEFLSKCKDPRGSACNALKNSNPATPLSCFDAICSNPVNKATSKVIWNDAEVARLKDFIEKPTGADKDFKATITKAVTKRFDELVRSLSAIRTNKSDLINLSSDEKAIQGLIWITSYFQMNQILPAPKFISSPSLVNAFIPMAIAKKYSSADEFYRSQNSEQAAETTFQADAIKLKAALSSLNPTYKKILIGDRDTKYLDLTLSSKQLPTDSDRFLRLRLMINLATQVQNDKSLRAALTSDTFLKGSPSPEDVTTLKDMLRAGMISKEQYNSAMNPNAQKNADILDKIAETGIAELNKQRSAIISKTVDKCMQGMYIAQKYAPTQTELEKLKPIVEVARNNFINSLKPVTSEESFAKIQTTLSNPQTRIQLPLARNQQALRVWNIFKEDIAAGTESSVPPTPDQLKSFLKMALPLLVGASVQPDEYINPCSDVYPSTSLIDHFDLLNKDVVISLWQIQNVGLRGTVVHELGHRLYYSRDKLSHKTKASIDRSLACISNIHKKVTGMTNLQAKKYESEDFSDMMEVFTASKDEPNAFCGYLQFKDPKSLGFTPEKNDTHSNLLYEAVNYESIVHGSIPAQCTELASLKGKKEPVFEPCLHP